MTRGAFIVLEGIDRTGKTTQSNLLVETLQNLNIKVEHLSFPNRTSNTGQLISKYLSNTDYQTNDQTIHLLFSANRWEYVSAIISKLLSGISLIVDRYSYSGIAYSVAKGLDFEWCLQPEIGLPQPDIVLFLDLNPKYLINRPGFGEERYENISMQQNVSRIFKQFAENDNNWKMVDANQSFEEVHKILLNNAKKIIEDVQSNNKPLTTISCSKVIEKNHRAENEPTIIKDLV